MVRCPLVTVSVLLLAAMLILPADLQAIAAKLLKLVGLQLGNILAPLADRPVGNTERLRQLDNATAVATTEVLDGIFGQDCVFHLMLRRHPYV